MGSKKIRLCAQKMLIILDSIVNLIGTTYIINVMSMRSFNLTKDKIIIRAPKNMRKVAPASISTIHMFHMLVGKKVTINDPSPFMVLVVHQIHKKHTSGMIGVELLFAFSPSPSLFPLANEQSCRGLIKFIPILLEASWKGVQGLMLLYFPWCVGSGVPPQQGHQFTRSSTLISACRKVYTKFIPERCTILSSLKMSEG